jgi:hypothetical protein
MSRTWVGFIEETCTLVDVMEYDGDHFDKIPGATYVEIFPPLHPDAIKLEKSSDGVIRVVEDNDKREKLYNSKLRNIRSTRNMLLKETDFIFCSDITEQMSQEDVTKWKEYRRKLRDFPTCETTDPFNPIWPEKPTLKLT